ncbi:MAG: DUF1549 domain-containing protein, partial [Gemmataceae bacterium]|nr:DUF1549 domain-containing protein [Gemmataceae bacterium]
MLFLALLVPASDLFRERVAPLLADRCVSCHDGTRKRGGLDLSTRAGLAALADKRKILAMVSGPTPRMPRLGPKLAAAEVASLKAWIDAGAAWPEGVVLKEKEQWWSLRKLERPPVPRMAGASNPIDAFLLARLEKEGLRMSPEAPRAVLLRRLCYDLTGLPPTPAQIDAFLADHRPDAYERLADRLLSSPAYGERWARHWLDVARYADTHGYDKDKRRDDAWPYRDWVVSALNAGLPWRDFVRMQLAGDVLKPGTREGLAAGGFVVAGPWDFVGHVELREGTVDKLKTRVNDRDDMLAAALGTFASATVGCARCHDHKFDPIPMRDYYRLQAVFAGVERGSRRLPGTPGPLAVSRTNGYHSAIMARADHAKW